MARDVLEVTFDVESNITGGQNFMSGEGKATGVFRWSYQILWKPLC